MKSKISSMNEKYKTASRLTSTVKKDNTYKLGSKQHIESAINEQSMITTSSNTPVRKNASVKSDKHGVRILYFLKDLTQVIF